MRRGYGLRAAAGPTLGSAVHYPHLEARWATQEGPLRFVPGRVFCLNGMRCDQPVCGMALRDGSGSQATLGKRLGADF
jgi:hypothetical protein